MIQVNRIYLIFNRLVTKKFLVDTSDSNTMCNRLNIRLLLVISCFQWFKDTKMKANHNLNGSSPKEV